MYSSISRKHFLFFRLDHRVHKPGLSRSNSQCFQNWITLCSLYGNIADAPYPPWKQWHLTYKAKGKCGVVTAWDEAAQIKRAMEWIRDRDLNRDCLQVRVRMHSCGRGDILLHSSDSATGAKTLDHNRAHQMRFVYFHLLIQLFEGNRDTTVKTTLRAGRTRVRIPAGGIGFFSSPKRPDQLWDPKNLPLHG